MANLHIKLRQTNNFACCLMVESDKWQAGVKRQGADTCIIIMPQ